MSFLLRRKGKNTAPAVATPAMQPSPGNLAKQEHVEPPPDAPRVVIIGAGSRGDAYAKPIHASGLARIVAVAEPIDQQRARFGRRYVWGAANRATAEPYEEFKSWETFVEYEKKRRERVAAGEIKAGEGPEGRGVDIAFVCVLDEQHAAVVQALAPLGIHIMCEKPLATSLADCLKIYGSLLAEWERLGQKTIFGIGHVLRYAPHNVLLRKLVREERVIGEIMSVEHTEPVGWWHFEHSYVRGNWRKESTTAPSLLTKSCHDIDFLLWMLCSPAPGDTRSPHLPARITSSGSRQFYRKAWKPVAAGDATNCLSCPIESSCKHSAKRQYLEKNLENGNTRWPIKIVVPEIEDLWETQGKQKAVDRLMDVLREDYGPDTPEHEVEKRNWFGRCVWESDNDVCDDQSVTISWNDDPLPQTENDQTATAQVSGLNGRGAKSAQFHMVAFTEKVCERRGYIYGTEGEIRYDSNNIAVNNFKTGYTKVHHVPPPPDSGHGGGDDELALNMLKAVIAVRGGKTVDKAQRMHLGCTLEEVVRSHAAVFAAEEARTQNKVVHWDEYWAREVDGRLKDLGLSI